MLVLLAAAGCSARDGGTGPAPSSGASWDPGSAEAYADALVTATDAARTGEGLAAFTDAPCAHDLAVTRARDLLGSAELEHASLVPVTQACAPDSTSAENLGRGAVPAAELVDAWMASPGHRANIVDPGLTGMTIGCVDAGDEGYLCSQLFVGP